MEVIFLVESGNLGSDGNIIRVDGVSILEGGVRLTKGFDTSEVIGEAFLFKENGALKAKAYIPDELLDCYPAIGVRVIDAVRMDNGGFMVMESEAISVMLTYKGNADSSIKRIRDQVD